MLTKPIEQLVSGHLLENHADTGVRMRWTYPSIDGALRAYIEKRCGLADETTTAADFDSWPRYQYYHYRRVWIYMLTSEPFGAAKVPQTLASVKQLALAFVANDFNPEKYETLAKLFAKIYAQTGDVGRLLANYLSILIHGSFVTEDNGTFACAQFDPFEATVRSAPIKAIIRMFGLDIILVYTALVLRRRIAVYHYRLETLLQFVRSLTAFVSHRRAWDEVLYPSVELANGSEIDELRSLDHYIAGFLDSEAESRADLYDIYVNLAAVEITVAHSAREAFAMTKTHKEIAVFMCRQADNTEISDQDVIVEIGAKTAELIKILRLMGGADAADGAPVTMEALRERKLAPNLESFLWNLAVAERLV